MANETKFEIFEEILASDKLGAFHSWNWNDSVLQQLGNDPSILWERIKRDPWSAIAIFSDMEDKDSTLFSCLEKRRDGVLALPRFLKPHSEKRQDKKIAEFIEETIENFWGGGGIFNTLNNTYKSALESFLDEALEAVGDGLSIGEKIFANAKDRVYIEEIKFKPQHLFAFGDNSLNSSIMATPQTGELYLRSGVTVEHFAGEKLPEWKFFTFSYRSRKGNRWGNPLKRKCFWQTWIKRNGVKNWLRYVEKSSASVVAKYPGGASEAEKQKAIEAASAVVEENAIAIPERFILEVHEMVRNIGTSHKELVDDYCNAEIMRAVVGQTLTGKGSDGGGSRSLGEIHYKVEQKKIEKDAKALMSVIDQQIIAPLVFLNFGPNTPSPKYIFQYEESEGLNSKAERYEKLFKIGMPLSKRHLYEEFQMPRPTDDTDVLGKSVNEEEEKTSDDKAEFAEKKTLNLNNKSNLKTERFKRLRPSMIHFSDK